MTNTVSEKNKKILCFVFAVTFIWGFAAHGFAFQNSNFSHDSLSEFYGAYGSNRWKIQLGRFIIPVYKAIFRTDVTIPWMIGLLSLTWIAISAFLIIRIFHVQSKITCVFISGILTTNITVASTAATYMHDFDGNMFALMCATVAVYLWRNYNWLGILAGAIFIALALGIYQSYLSVTIVLVILVCILDLLNKKSFSEVLVQGLKSIFMILLAAVLYYLTLNIVLNVTQIPLSSGQYNSLDSMSTLTPRSLLSLTFYSYLDCFYRITNIYSPYPDFISSSVSWILIFSLGTAYVFILYHENIGKLEKLLLLFLTALLPLGMNITYILVSGIVHDLMVYAIWLFYLLLLLIADWLIQNYSSHKLPIRAKYICTLAIFIILYGNVQWDNAMYLKKDLEQDSSLSLWTRIVYTMETQENYEPGVTPVVFVGSTHLLNDVIPGFEPYRNVVGMESSQVASTREDYRVRSYFQYILNVPVYIPSSDIWNNMQTDPRVAELPCYPTAGSVTMIDGVLVVKLGNQTFTD